MFNKMVEQLHAGTTDERDADEIDFEEILERLNADEINGDWMEKVRGHDVAHTISSNEVISLSALIAYVAHKVGDSEFRVERELADRFHVANIKFMPAARFDDALRFLVDRAAETAD